jgi:hypothetical protein
VLVFAVRRSAFQVTAHQSALRTNGDKILRKCKSSIYLTNIADD